jgi:hypothetical protein
MMRKICKSFGPGTKQPKEPYYNSVWITSFRNKWMSSEPFVSPIVTGIKITNVTG